MVDWTASLNRVVAELKRRKKTYRAVGSDGEDLELYLRPESLHLMRLKEDLKLRRYKPRPLQVKLLSKNPDESPRKVFVPANRDYLVARAINFEISKSTRPRPLPAKHVLRALIREISSELIRFSSVVRLDIRDFFGSIPYSKATKWMLDDSEIDDEVIYLLQQFSDEALAATARTGTKKPASKEIAPQGLPYSPAIANWYIKSVHEKGIDVSGKYSIYRFADDMLLLFRYPTSTLNLHWRVFQLKSLLRWGGFRIHPMGAADSKSRIIRTFDYNRDFNFLGLSLTLSESGKVSYRLPEDVVKSEKTKIWKLFNRYINPSESSNLKKFGSEDRLRFLHYRLLLKSAGCRYQGKVYGFPNYWGFSDDASSFKRLDIYVRKLAKEFGVVSRGAEGETKKKLFGVSYFKAFQKIRERDEAYS